MASGFRGDITLDIISGSLFATSTGVTTNADAAGASVDIANDVANILTCIQVVGNVAGTGTPTLTTVVQESADGSTSWANVANQGTFGGVTTTNNVAAITFEPTKRYVRTTGTVAGTNPVFETTTIIYAPRRDTPTNQGGFSTSAAPG